MEATYIVTRVNQVGDKAEVSQIPTGSKIILVWIDL